jgi:hypothetical protein
VHQVYVSGVEASAGVSLNRVRSSRRRWRVYETHYEVTARSKGAVSGQVSEEQAASALASWHFVPPVDGNEEHHDDDGDDGHELGRSPRDRHRVHRAQRASAAATSPAAATRRPLQHTCRRPMGAVPRDT